MIKKIMVNVFIFTLLLILIGASLQATAATINAVEGSNSSTGAVRAINVNHGWISGEVTELDSLTISSISSTLLEDVTICVYDSISQNIVASTKTDVYGQYSFSVDVGTYTVYADKEGYSRKTYTGVEVTKADITEVDFTLSKIQEEESGWIYGEVYTTSTSADSYYKILLQGVRICITSISPSLTDSYYSTDESCAYSDSSGDYKIYADGGSYKVTASKSGYYSSSKYVSVQEGEGAELNFNLVRKAEPPSLSDRGSIYGRVLGADDDTDADAAPIPLASASVSIRKSGAATSALTASSNVWRTTLTDENGEYRFTSLELGETYEIKASKYGYETSSQFVTLENIAEVNFELTKKSDIIIPPDDPIVIIVVNDSLKPLREMSGEQNIQKIDIAISEGYVGGELIIENTLESDIVLYDELLSISSLDIDTGRISLVISGDDDLTGKTIVINAETGVFDENGNIMLTYDGEEISMADDFTDILDPNNDNYHAEYLIVEGSNGMQILVSIPHFSSHTINIYSVIEALGGIEAVLFYMSTCILASVLFIATIYVRKRI
jgi:hypothetical protein